MIHPAAINYYKSNIRFKEICIGLLSSYYPWDTDQIINYKDILDFERIRFNHNQNIVLTLEDLEMLKNHIDWSGLHRLEGIEYNLNFFEKYEARIDFSSIHSSTNIDWSNELLDKYQDRWNWELLSGKPILANLRNIRIHGDRYDWLKFSSNRYLQLSEKLIDEFIDKWAWNRLCANPALKLNEKDIKKYSSKIDWISLSRNPSMESFVLAYAGDYNWDWIVFTRHSRIVFGRSIFQSLIKKFTTSNPLYQSLSQEIKMQAAKRQFLNAAIYNRYLDRKYLFSTYFAKCIPWKELINLRPELLTSIEIEENIKLEDYERVISGGIVSKLSTEYINANKDALMKFKSSLFRNGKIDEDFIKLNAADQDWFHLAFNTEFDWSLDFLVNHIDRFERNYGLSRNVKLYELFFREATRDEVIEILECY